MKSGALILMIADEVAIVWLSSCLKLFSHKVLVVVIGDEGCARAPFEHPGALRQPIV